MGLTQKQVSFIHEKFEEKCNFIIRDLVDDDLFYDDDIYYWVQEFSNISNVLLGKFDIDDLRLCLYERHLEQKYDEIAELVYFNWLDDDEKAIVDNLETE